MLFCSCLLSLVLAGLPGDAHAAGRPTPPGAVVEHLRLKVPAGTREAWLQAEEETWGPWLRRQDGFLGRDLLWDEEKEEGLLLIRWHSRRQWLAIPASEIEAVQGRFEAAARRALALVDPSAGEEFRATNPFPLVFSGELDWVGLTPPAPEAVMP